MMSQRCTKPRKMHFLHWQLLLVLATTGVKTSPGSALELDNFSVIDFLKDVQRLHGVDNVLIAGNQNATVATNFIGRGAAGDTDSDSDNDNDFKLNFNLDNDIVASTYRSGLSSLGSSALTQRQFVRAIMRELEVCVLQMSELGMFYLKRHYSVALLAVVHIDGTVAQHSGLLQRLAMALRHMTQTKLLFLLDFDVANEEVLRQLFRYCWQQRMINVVALFANYQQTAIFYSYTHFPEFQIERRTIATDLLQRKEIYPYRLANLRGYKLPYILGGSDPRLIVYRKPDGDMYVGGFAGHLFKAFAKKYNCQLVQPVPMKIGALDPSQKLIALVRNGTVELSAGLTFPAIPLVGFTYPYEQMNWCLMIPIEPDIPYYEFYVIVFELTTFLITLALMVLISMVLSCALYQHGSKPDLLDLIFHDNCLRGVLGQSFSEVLHPPLIVRFIYLQICVLGILLTTSYNSYFATYVTSAPKQPRLKSFEDVLQSGMKVFVWTPEYTELLGRTAEFRKYTAMFHKEPDYRNYLRMRDTFNTKYIYMVPTTKRIIVNEQQKIFTTPIFRQSEDLCFFHNIPMCFPIHENSLFLHTLYVLMLETAQAGLTDYWHKTGFYELINAGKLQLVDLSKKSEFHAMQAGDLQYIWFAMACAYALVTVLFLGELCVYYRFKFYNCMKLVGRKLCCCRA